MNVVAAPDLDALGKDEMRAVRVTVTTKNGAALTEAVTYRTGHWRNPISDADLASKFRNLATRVITDEAAERIEGIVMAIDAESDPIPMLAEDVQQVRR